MNPWVQWAVNLAPKLKTCEKMGKYIVFFVVVGFLAYFNSEKLMEVGGTMSKNLHDEDEEWEESKQHKGNWMIELMIRLFEDNINWFALKEISFYLGLFVVGLVGFGVLNYYNVKHEEKLMEADRKWVEEQKAKQEKEAGKSKFYKKND